MFLDFLGRNSINTILTVFALLAGMALHAVAEADQEQSAISAFAENQIGDWKQHDFSRSTEYGLTKIENDWALEAISEGAASAFYRSVEVNLEKTPILTWRWRVETTLQGVQEREKSGDDYAARVYVVHKRGFFDKGIAVNYVWSSSHKKGSAWPNAYALKSSAMLALQDSTSATSIWHEERRNVREDFNRLLGRDVRSVEIVVLMTDTDNSGQAAHAFYGDLSFASD